jgi:hypothetical protein
LPVLPIGVLSFRDNQQTVYDLGVKTENSNEEGRIMKASIKMGAGILAFGLLQACSTGTDTQSKRVNPPKGASTTENSVTTNKAEGSPEVYDASTIEGLNLTAEQLSAKFEAVKATRSTSSMVTAEATKEASPSVIAPIAPAPADAAAPAPKDADMAKIASAAGASGLSAEKIRAAFAEKMKKYPNALTQADADYLSVRLGEFTQHMAAKRYNQASTSWNEFSHRMAELHSKKSQKLSLTYYREGGRRYGGGLLTTLIGAVGSVLNIALEVVTTVVVEVVPIVVEVPLTLVDAVFQILI